MKWTLDRVCKTLDLKYQGPGDLPLHRVAGLEDLAPGVVVFVNRADALASLDPDPECVLVVPQNTALPGRAMIFSAHPQADHVRITQLLYPGLEARSEIHPSAVLGSGVKLGKNVTIDAQVFIGDKVSIGDHSVIRPGAVIMEGSEIGAGCLVYPNVAIREYCSIGNRVTLHNNVSIGADGYGYFQQQGRHHKIPQVGTVRIDDDVEIGACSSIDRARFSVTRIGEGTKVDNQVQVAHNVQIGSHCLLVAGVGIAGSTVIGDHCVLAGQVGVIEQLSLGNRITVLAKSLVTDSFPADDQVLCGIPARPARLWKRMLVRNQQLDSLFKRVRRLEQSRK